MSGFKIGDPVVWLQDDYEGGKWIQVIRSGVVEALFPRTVVVKYEDITQAIMRNHVRRPSQIHELENMKTVRK